MLELISFESYQSEAGEGQGAVGSPLALHAPDLLRVFAGWRFVADGRKRFR